MNDEISTSAASRLEPLSVLWHILVAPQTSLALMGLITLVLVLGTLISPQLTSGPTAWLEVQPNMLNRGTNVVQALGLYDLYQTFWFRALLVLAGLVLFVWAVEAADLAWRAARREGWTASTFGPWTRQAARIHLFSSLPPQSTLALVGDFLTLHGYGWTKVSADPGPNIIAGRRQGVLWARPLAYGALVLALVGLAIVSGWGWQSEDWQPIAGESRAVGHDSPYEVRLDAFRLESGKDGRVLGYRGDITWLEGETVVAQDRADVGKPATIQGVAVRPVGYLPILDLQAWDAQGRPLAIEVPGEEPVSRGRVQIRFSSAEAQPHVSFPNHDLLALAFQPLSANGRPALYLVLLRDGGMERQPLGVLYESGSARFDDVQLQVDLAYGPILRMDYRPAMGFVLGSMAMAVAALATGWMLSPKLACIEVEPDGDGAASVRIVAIHGTRSGLWLPALASLLQRTLADET